ncbi:hypothetical protein CYMTET_46159 [Cymbomonas tetramitiformis]|uniref:Uncharacterized protein n=1 Tax=Cymbomonas tetramitiformis TaxID=36881 RepID=A0AAE0BY83_9CHLO|nr:hypothetical protein CYMTET_46159 [Cymbomonas tetramitiformis]
MPAAEKRKSFTAVAVEYDAIRHFGGGNPAKNQFPAIRFQVLADVTEDPDHEGYWMKLATWNRYRHNTCKDDRDAEARYIKPPALSDNNVDQFSEEEEEDGSDKISATAIYSHFILEKSGIHVPQRGRKKGRELKATWHKCGVPGCDKSSSVFKVVAGSTGSLYTHLKTHHPELATALRLQSSNSKIVLNDDGTVVVLFTFQQALEHHVRFVAWIVTDLDQFHKAKSTSLRAWIRGLEPRYRPPCRLACERIALCMAELILEKIHDLIRQNGVQVGNPHAGGQSDLWSKKSAHEAFAALIVYMVILMAGKLLEVAFVVAFAAFPENRQSGAALARWFRATLIICKLRVEGLTMLTLDGASNNKKAARLLAAPLHICKNHDLQRAVVTALGLTGGKKKPSRNPVMKKFLGRVSRMCRSFNSSTQHNLRLAKSQMQRGIKQHQVQRVTQKHNIRWSGWSRMSRKARVLEKDIKFALTGQEDGLCLEDPVLVPPEATEVLSLESATSARATSSAADDVAGDCDDEASEDDDEDIDDPDDLDQVEANEAAGKEFSLAHRCLDSNDWSSNYLLEAVLNAPHEANMRLQTAVKKRGLKLDRRVMLALRLNPSYNTSATGASFKDKQGSFEILEAEYRVKLRHRFQVMSIPVRVDIFRGVESARSVKRSGMDALQDLLGEQEPEVETESVMEDVISKEIELYASLRKTAGKNPAYNRDSQAVFQVVHFWEVNMIQLPVHAATFRAEVGCVKATSANVEQLFSNSGALLSDYHANKLGNKLMEAYMLIRGNWKYEFLRPSAKEIGDRYKAKYGELEAVSAGKEDSCTSDMEE